MNLNEFYTYEKNQNFNAITKFLHATRYRNLQNIAQNLSPNYGKKLRVLDVGCCSCLAFEMLCDLRDDIDYVGVEINEDFSEIANHKFGTQKNFQIHCADIATKLEMINEFDLIIGLESFEHIPETSVVRVIEAIGRSNFQKLYITVPNEIGLALLVKNVGSMIMGYSRHEEYTWKETWYAFLYELDRVGIHGNGHKGFDWHWLAQTLRQNVKITQTYTSPRQFVPKFVSPSLGFLCTPRPPSK